MQKFIGVYDTFSAMVVYREHRDIFLSGLSYMASCGLPDSGFFTWQDVVEQSRRIMSRCPDCRLLVDLDDGFGGPDIVGYSVKALERIVVFGVILEDQKRPKKCGHLSGKRVIPLSEYLEVIQAVLSARRRLFVVARTDAMEEDEIIRRIDAFAQLEVDAILVDGIDWSSYVQYKKRIENKTFIYNYIAGGQSALKAAGCDILLLSMPCLAVAGKAIERMVHTIKKDISQIDGYELSDIRALTEKGFKG